MHSAAISNVKMAKVSRRVSDTGVRGSRSFHAETKATCTGIRFRNDPFWGVHAYHTSIRKPRSDLCELIQGNVPPPENHDLCVLHVYWQRRIRLELKTHFFCLFPLLASVVLLYCFTCLCPVEGVYILCESWRQLIKERLQRQNETQAKDEAEWKKNNTRLSSKKTTR